MKKISGPGVSLGGGWQPVKLIPASRTIEFLGLHISKNEIVSMELLSSHNKMTRKKMILVTEVTTRKWSENECLLQICQILLNYV